MLTLYPSHLTGQVFAIGLHLMLVPSFQDAQLHLARLPVFGALNAKGTTDLERATFAPFFVLGDLTLFCVGRAIRVEGFGEATAVAGPADSSLVVGGPLDANVKALGEGVGVHVVGGAFEVVKVELERHGWGSY